MRKIAYSHGAACAIGYSDPTCGGVCNITLDWGPKVFLEIFYLRNFLYNYIKNALKSIENH